MDTNVDAPAVLLAIAAGILALIIFAPARLASGSSIASGLSTQLDDAPAGLPLAVRPER